MANSNQRPELRLGFVGMGAMGSRMANRLLAVHYGLTVYNRTHERTHPLQQRGAKVAQIDLARRLAEAIWHMLTRNQPFAPAGAADPLAA